MNKNAEIKLKKSIVGFHLSSQQRRVLNSERNINYLGQMVIGFECSFEPEKIKIALEEIVSRHNILRTVFPKNGSTKNRLQTILDTAYFDWRVVDLTNENPARQQQILNETTIRERESEFDLESSETLKAVLLALSSGIYTLILTLPSLRTDAQSLMKIAGELAAILNISPLPDEVSIPSISYVVYSDWQNNWLQDPDSESSRRYWNSLDWQEPLDIELPYKPDDTEQKIPFPKLAVSELPPDICRKIIDLSDKYEVEASVFLLACWHLLLVRLSNNQNLTIGVNCNGHIDEDYENLIGLLSNYVPFIGQFDKKDSLAKVLPDFYQNLQKTRSLRETFFQPADDTGSDVENNSDYFRICFDPLLRLPAYSDGTNTLKVKDLFNCTESFDLKMSILELPEAEDGWRIQLQYQPSICTPEDAEGLLASLRKLIESVLETPEESVGSLKIISVKEEKEFFDFNRTEASIPSIPFHRLFEQQVKKTPHNIAVKSVESELSFSELNKKANRIANFLRSENIKPDDLIGIYHEPDSDLLAALLGILKAGAAYLPLDSNYPAQRMQFILEEARVEIVLTDSANEKNLTFFPKKIFNLDQIESRIAEFDSEDIDLNLDTENLAYVIYTSGSTGNPKGVMVTHQGLLNYLNWGIQHYPFQTSGSKSLVHSSITFDLTVTSLFMPLLCGEPVTFTPSSQAVENLIASLRSDEEYSLLKLTPSHLRLLTRQSSAAEICSKIKILIVGGEALTSKDVADWRKFAPETLIFNEYGPTETVVGCCVHKVDEASSDDGNILIGKPIHNTKLYVLDDVLNPVPKGVSGELYISGYGISRGYLTNPGLTAEHFIPDPFSDEPGKRMYRTGDIVRFPDDDGLDYLGRADRQIKIRGFRVELGEIEKVLQQHPSIKECAVLLTEENDDKYLTVCFTAVEQQIAAQEDLRIFLHQKLPHYMVPAVFTEIESIPLTSNGKTDYKKLALLSSQKVSAKKEYIPPSDTDQEILAAIWSQVLGVEEIGITDNYFTLGGDSIKSLQITARAQERGLYFSIDDLFKFPTIATLADFIREAQNDKAQTNISEPFYGLNSNDRLGIPQNIEDAYPLTALQAGMIFHREFSDNSAIYHDLSSFFVRAPFDLEILESAVNSMVERHPALRTYFSLSHYSQPLQLVEQQTVADFKAVDIRYLNHEEQEEFIDSFFEEEKQIGFDVAKLPLIRFLVHIRGDQQWQFTLSFHHAILDGWSEATMITEMFHHYMSLINEKPLAPRQLSTTFRDYVANERKIVSSAEAFKYWEEKLDDNQFTVIPRWKENHSQPPAQRDIIVYEVPFADAVSEGLKRLAVSNTVPIKSVLLAAHLKVLSLLSGQKDVTTCIVSSGRLEEKDGDRVVGLFINSMPFRMNLNNGTWSELVTSTFENEREAMPFRRFPMAELKRRLNLVNVSDSLFYFTHYHVYQSFQKIPDVELLGARLYEETSFPLAANFRVDPFTARVHFVLKCDAHEFSNEQVESIGEFYKQVLTEMAFNSEARHAEENLIPSDELKLISDWSNAQAEPAESINLSLTRIFEENVKKFPHSVAVSFENDSLTYEELNNRSNRLARYLIKCGVGPESLVGLCCSRNLSLPVGILGILKAAAAYVPLDPDYPSERLSYILKDAQVKTVVTEEHLSAHLPTDVRTVCLDRDEREIASESADDCEFSALPDNTAYVIYTSGSTGQPKGTLISHNNVVRLFFNTRNWFNIDEGDVWTMFHSFGFDFSVWELWGALLHGGKVVILPQMVCRSPEAMYEVLRDEKVTILNQTPSAFKQLSKVVTSASPDNSLALRLIIFGGEALDFASLQPWFRYWGNNCPEMINMYGITETTIHVTYRPLTEADSEKGQGSFIGVPIPDLDVYVLDDKLHPVPIETPGELYVGGPGLSRGYLNRPDLTGLRFVPNPYSFKPGQRLYRTGDLVRFKRSGELEYLGRIDDQVKIRGFRIELGEIEYVLRLYPRIQEAVAAIGNDDFENKSIIAYLVRAGEEELDLTDLRDFLKKHLPAYMIPASYVLIDSLPLTSHGKINRKALGQLETSDILLDKEFTNPQNEIEEILAGIWAEALKLDKVGIKNSFFELGGHSLTATLVVARIREAFKIDLPLRALYESQNIEKLAEVVVALQGSETDEKIYVPLPSIEPDIEHRYEPFPLTNIQQAYWVGRQPGFELGDIPAHIYLEFDTVGLDLALLEKTVNRLIRRHDMLRAIILETGFQQILEDVPEYKIEYVDLTDEKPEKLEAQVESVRKRMSHQKFDTTRFPLFEIKAHLLPDGHIRLHFSIDLLITDADSLGILNRELGYLYQNPESSLPDLEISFREYFFGEAKLVESNIYRQSKTYWLNRVDSLPPAPQLPYAQSLITLEEKTFTRLRGGLSADDWKKLKARAARSGLTPSGLLLSAYAEILGLWSKKQAFTINVTTYNCLPFHPQARNLVGDFTTLTLVAIDGGQTTFEERAKQIQQQFVEDLDNSYFGGIEVLREIARRNRDSLQANMPIVFTSTLPLHTREGDRKPPFPVTLVEGVTQSPQTVLDHQVSEENGELTVRWDYLIQAFQPGVIEEMFAAYGHLLRSLAADDRVWHEASRSWLIPPAQQARRRAFHLAGNAALEARTSAVSSISPATAAAVSEVLPTAAVSTVSDISGDLSYLHSGICLQALEQPAAAAVLSARRQLSFQQLCGEAALLAESLRAAGCRRGEIVGVLMEKGWEQVVAVLAILQAGGAYLPVDSRLPAARQAYLLENTGVTRLLTQPRLTAELRMQWSGGGRLAALGECRLSNEIAVWEVTAQAADSVEIVEAARRAARAVAAAQAEQTAAAAGAELAYVIYTSGSTGQPKGVRIGHAAALNTIAAINREFAVTGQDRVLGLSELSFDLSVYDIFGVLGAGGAIVLGSAESRRDPGEWQSLADEYGVSIWNSVPALMEMQTQWLEAGGGRLAERLRLVMLSGDWINVSLPERIRRVSRRADLEVVSLGGATEAGIWSILHRIGEVDESWRSIPYGRPLANQRIYVLNERGEEVPEEVTGELYIGGAGLAEGYQANEEQTRRRFIESRWGERLYRTGDLGKQRRAGWIEFAGREDTQVKVQGHRIELGEIESVLNEHGQVKQAVVTAVGEPGLPKRLVAYVTLHSTVQRSSKPNETHLSSDNNSPIIDAQEREVFKKQQHGIRKDLFEMPKIDLDFSIGNDRLSTLYFDRRSHREFLNEPILFKQFSEFIACLRGAKVNGHSKYRYSSGGSLYPIQTYIYLKPDAVENLSAGLYYYHPQFHQLINLDNEIRLAEDIHWLANRKAFRESAFSIFLIGDMNAITPLYGTAATNFILLEAGIMTHLLETEAANFSLGLCQIGSLDFEPIKDSFNLGDSHLLLHSLVGGLSIPCETHSIEFYNFSDSGESDMKTLENSNHNSGKAEAETAATKSDLQEFLRKKLPEAFVPNTFIFLDKLPISSNGKIDRKSLPSPDMEDNLQNPHQYVAPQNDLQKTIADILSQELELKTVGIKDNFFDLGANSLHLIKVHTKIKNHLGTDFPVVTLFRNPTIETLAKQLESLDAVSDSENDAGKRASKQRENLNERRRRAKQKVKE